jgi:hypothetical protein
VLDTDRFITLLAMSTIMWNWDGYPMAANNYRIYHDPETDKLVFIPHGLDQMFWEAQGPICPRMRGLVAAAVMQVTEARRAYRERLAVLHTNVFKVEVLTNRIDRLAAVIRPLKPDTDAQAARLKRQITLRGQSIAEQLQAPEPQPPRFVGDVAALDGWRKLTSDRTAQLDETTADTDLRVLRVKQESPGNSSWSTRVWLPGGTYEFAGRAKVVRIDPTGSARQGGAWLRPSAPLRMASRRLTASSGWEELRCQFVAQGGGVDLNCELRNVSGEVWFDAGSLQLKRVSPTSGFNPLNLFR